MQNQFQHNNLNVINSYETLRIKLNEIQIENEKIAVEQENKIKLEEMKN